jgi:pimeloyl-ACP methyl ester carboxylesterase
MAQSIEIPKANGGLLHAVHYKRDPKQIQDPIVIFCHGFSGDKYECERFTQAAEAFNLAGIDVILFDFSGSGENDREPVLLSTQINDLEIVYQWVQQQGYRRIGTLGLSFGGYTALLAKLPERKAAVFWAPAFYMIYIIGKTNIKLAKIIRFFKKRIYRKCSGNTPPIFITYDFIKELTEIGLPHTQLADFTTPALIIQGLTDTDVRPEYSRDAYAHMPPDAQHKLLELPDCNHMFEGENTTKAIQASVKWFQNYL